MGVWIEIEEFVDDTGYLQSLPVWECGLKLKFVLNPLALYCHSLYGSVD